MVKGSQCEAGVIVTFLVHLHLDFFGMKYLVVQ